MSTTRSGRRSARNACACLPGLLAVLLLPTTTVAQLPLSAEDSHGYRSVSGRAVTLVQARATAVPCAGGNGALRIVNTPLADTYKPGIQYVWVLLPKACASFRVRMVEASGDIVQLFRQHADDAAVIASGGFWVRQQPLMAEGLHISQAAAVRPRAQWTSGGQPAGGFLAQAAHAVQIFPATTTDTELAQHAEVLQTRPVLLQAGQLAVARDDFARGNRVAVLVGRSGAVGVLGVFGPVSSAFSLYELALLARQVAQRAGLDAAAAINLEGGPGAHIHLPGLNKSFGVLGERQIASVSLFGRSP
jgi:hypothetical protein